MSDALTDPGAPDDDTLAGEYVLGVLDTAEMMAVRRRARAEAPLRALIARWEGHLLPLTAIVVPLAPPPALWDRIAAAIALAPGEAAAAQNLGRATLRPRVWPWQLSTGLSLALAAGIAAFAVLRPVPTVVRLASLAPIGARPAAFIAAARADGRVTLAAVVPDVVPAGRELQLWVLPPGAAKVASLGLVPRAGATFDLGPPPPAGTQYFISLEQSGGSTTGQPSATVLYGGAFASAEAP